MIRNTGTLLLVLFFVGLVRPAAAHPEYLSRLQDDPFSRSDVGSCGNCHVDPTGGGARNAFGIAFENLGHEITPMLRADFPDRFTIQTTLLADGSAIHFADPSSESVIFDREGEKFVIDLVAGTMSGNEEEVPQPGNSLSFFVTSEGLGEGARLGGLAGADRHCQVLAEAVGAGEKSWRAYLSTSFDGKPAINAGDRIGSGPWYNARGRMIAKGASGLHAGLQWSKAMALNEKSEIVSGRSDDLNRHDILTGSRADGSAAPGMNCDNWTSSGEGSAMVGHHDLEGGGDAGNSWNAAHPSRGCSQDDLRGSGGDGLFYCFAIQ
jgi:hypothetical protein